MVNDRVIPIRKALLSTLFHTFYPVIIGRRNNTRRTEALIQIYNKIDQKSWYWFNPWGSTQQENLTVNNPIVGTEGQEKP